MKNIQRQLNEIELAELLVSEEREALLSIIRDVANHLEPESAIAQQKKQLDEAEAYLAELRSREYPESKVQIL